MEEWFVKGACDGFAIQPDVSFDGIADFVDQVIPILQERGLFHDDYEGTTLRDHMGVSYQYVLLLESNYIHLFQNRALLRSNGKSPVFQFFYAEKLSFYI